MYFLKFQLIALIVVTQKSVLQSVVSITKENVLHQKLLLTVIILMQVFGLVVVVIHAHPLILVDSITNARNQELLLPTVVIQKKK